MAHNNNDRAEVTEPHRKVALNNKKNKKRLRFSRLFFGKKKRPYGR